MASHTLRAFANVPANTTDYILVPALDSYVVKVVAIAFQSTTATTTVTFNSKGTGAGVPISCLFEPAANGIDVLQHNPDGWFVTKQGRALSCTTGQRSTLGIQISYIYDNS